jgi:hypothetical protein
MENMNIKNPQNEDDMTLLIKKLKILFEYYCQFGERLNLIYMKSNKYIKLALESEILDQSLNRTRLELIYKSETKSNQMDFKIFLNSLIKIAEWKYLKGNIININDSENKQNALKFLIEDHFNPLYEKLFSNSMAQRTNLTDQSHHDENKSLINPNQSNIIYVPFIDEVIQDPNIEDIFLDVCPVLYNIYRVYFPHEISLAEDFEFVKENSFKQYLKFIRDFELCPNFITKSAAFSIYQSEEEQESINSNNQYYVGLIKNVDLSSIIKYNNKNNNILGQHFNFFKFIRTIVKLAEYGYEKFENGLIVNKSNSIKYTNTISAIIPNYERLILILEKMEMSEGFINLEKKTNKTHSIKNATIVTKSLLEKLQKQNRIYGNNNSLLFENNNNNKENNITMNLFGPRNLEEKRLSLIYNNNYLELCELSSYIQEKYGEDLLHIFKAFCSFGDQLNTKYLRTKMFTKLLVEANLIHVASTERNHSIKTGGIGLKFNDVDTIFIKLASLPSNLENQTNTTEPFVTSQGKRSTVYSNNNNISFNNQVNLQSDCSLNYSFYNSNNKKKTPINSYAKIDFETFIISIEVVSRLLLPDLPSKEAVDYIICDHLFRYLSEYVNKSKIADLKIDYLRKKQSESDTTYTLQIAHKALLPVFKNYCDKTGLMNYDQFMR